MKVRIILGVLIIVLGLLAAIGPQTVFLPCRGRLFEVRDAGVRNLLNLAEGEGVEELLNAVNEGGLRKLMELQREREKEIIRRLIPMRCHWGARSMMGIGGMIALLGIALIIFPSVKTRLGLVMGVLSASLVSLFIPMTISASANPNQEILIGICMRNMNMECRTHFGPAITSISILLIIVSALYAVYLARVKEGAVSD